MIKSNVVVVGTGAPAVGHLPEAVLQLAQSFPAVKIRIVLTNQALKFVTPTSVRAVTGRHFFLDRWPEGEVLEASHVEMAAWADVIVVYPATLNFLARLALGLADSPLLLALQCTDAEITLAPSLPPGGHRGAAYRSHAAALGARSNVTLVPPVVGNSMSTGERQVGAPAGFATVLHEVGAALREQR